jgi:hypothetical protein
MYRQRPNRSSAWQQVALLVVFAFIFIYASW